MTRVFIDTYNEHSEGARELADYLGARRIRHERSRYRPRRSDTVINWGKSNVDNWFARNPAANYPTILNPRVAVRTASNKLTAFEAFQRFNVGRAEEDYLSFPMYTPLIEVARGWASGGSRIVSRSLLRGSGGRGMSVGETALEEIEGVSCKLWTKYHRKSREYRVHVFRGAVIDTQQKKRRDGVDADEQVRNHENGWVFAREGIEEQPEIAEVRRQALMAIQALGLDFGAVDVIFSVKKNKAWVLEVNTAPGLEGATITAYGEAFRNYIQEN